MSVTEHLFRPLMSAPARPLITFYDDADGTRIELSRVSLANWAAKTANWLRDEWDIEPGAPVAVALPAHWQTAGVLLGAWWCGAHVTADPAGAEIAFVSPGADAPGARTVAVVALDPLGRGLGTEPAGGKLDYLNEIRVFGDDFTPYQRVPGDTMALDELTVDELVTRSRSRASELGIGSTDRILSTQDWTFPGGVIDGLLAILAADASLVQCTHPDPAKMAARAATERTTLSTGNYEK